MTSIDADTVWQRVAFLAGDQVGVDAAGITPDTLFDDLVCELQITSNL